MTTTPAVCRACGSVPTIKAHIVPQAFAREAREDEKHLHLLGSTSGINQSGLFDRDILCARCDQLIGIEDKYAYEFCKRIEDETLPAEGAVLHYAADARRLVRFANSVLYRASVSQRPEFSKFTVGAAEDHLRDGLFGTAPADFEKLGEVIMLRYRHSAINPMKVFSYPYRVERDGAELVNFSLGGFRFMVRIGGEPIMARYAPLVLNGLPTVKAMVLQFESTQEFRGMAEMVHKT